MADDKKDPQSQLPIVAKPVESKLGLPGMDWRTPLVPSQLRETRRVAIGKKGDEWKKGASGTKWRPPMKLDHFLVTHREQDEKGDFKVDDGFHKKFGAKPREIPIKLLFDSIHMNLMIYLGYYAGRKPYCKGDGSIAARMEKGAEKPKKVDCPCDFIKQQGKCKYHLLFHFQLDGMAIGECAKFRSTSKNTMKYIQGGLWMVKQAVAEELGCSVDEAPLKNIPLVMRFQKETVMSPEGQARTIPVVHVGYNGTRDELRSIVVNRQKVLKETQQELIEMERKRYQTLLLPEPAEEAKEIADEFHPEAANEQAAVVEAKATVKTPAKDTTAFEKIDRASKDAMASSQLPKGLQNALDEAADEGDPGDPEKTAKDEDLPDRSSKPKEADDGWL